MFSLNNIPAEYIPLFSRMKILSYGPFYTRYRRYCELHEADCVCVRKEKPLTRIETFKKELESFGEWVENNGLEFNLLSIPQKLTYDEQFACIALDKELSACIQYLMSKKLSKSLINERKKEAFERKSPDISITIKEERAYIYTPYNKEFVARLKESLSPKARWSDDEKCWHVAINQAEAVKDLIKEVYGYNCDNLTYSVFDEKQSLLKQREKLKKELAKINARIKELEEC